MVFVHIGIECLCEAGDVRVRFFVDVERCAVRLYFEANELSQILNVCLAVALFMRGCASATYWANDPAGI